MTPADMESVIISEKDKRLGCGESSGHCNTVKNKITILWAPDQKARELFKKKSYQANLRTAGTAEDRKREERLIGHTGHEK